LKYNGILFYGDIRCVLGKELGIIGPALLKGTVPKSTSPGYLIIQTVLTSVLCSHPRTVDYFDTGIHGTGIYGRFTQPRLLIPSLGRSDVGRDFGCVGLQTVHDFNPTHLG